MLLQRLAQMVGVEVGIDLGGDDILVAQQLLHLTDAGTALQQMRGEGVAEGVGADLLVDRGALGGLLDDGEDHNAREALATIVQEENLVAVAAAALVQAMKRKPYTTVFTVSS